jgi:CBS domain-containing protein
MSKTSEIMTRDPVSLSPEDTAQTAAQLMRSMHIGPIPVVDADRKLVGIVTDRDLAIKVVAEGRAPRETRISDVMSSNPFTCGPNDDVETAIRTMEEHQVRRIPVVDDQRRLLGIIAQADVATRSRQGGRMGKALEGISSPSETESR